jgi:phospholipid-translocating ATPase
MASTKDQAKSLYRAILAFDVAKIFERRRIIGPPRSIYVNQSLPQDYFDAKGRPKKEREYETNQVITSKYTLITFLPRNLLEQFRRVANV